MGSSISLSVLAKTQKLKFVVADCGFTNLYDLIKGGYQNYHLTPLIHGVNFVMKHWYNYDMKDTSAISAVKNNRVPIYFIHGEEDTFIPPKNSKDLFDANPSYDELYLVKKAGHANSREVLGLEEYTNLIRGFLERIDK